MTNASGSSKRAALRAAQELEAKRKRTNRIMIAVASVVGVLIIALVGVILVQSLGKNSQAQITPANATADYGIQAYPGKAKPDALKVVIWEDFQCPWCKFTSDAYSKQLHSLAESGDIALEYKLVSFLDSRLPGDASHRAAMGATIADGFGKFTAYTDEVYANQPQTEGQGYPNALLRDTIPAKIGLTGDDLAKFQAQYDGKATDTFVTETNKLAATQQVPGTPYITVNGKEVGLLDSSRTPLAGTTPESLLAYLKAHAA